MRTASWENVDKQMMPRNTKLYMSMFQMTVMWIKRLHAKIHNMITIYIHYRTIYFKPITFIILIIVISNVFVCNTHSVFNDFVDYCVTGKRNRTGAHAL